jgi:hypothetical protein
MSDEILIDLSESERKLSVDLDEQQREELVEVRDHHDKPYMREKAAAILKVADNWSARAVAKYGLHKTRRPNTVRDWIHQYRNGGIDKLTISEGRGRKPAFSPEV